MANPEELKAGWGWCDAHLTWTLMRLLMLSSVSPQDYLDCISNQSLLLLGDEERNSLFGNIRDIYRFNRYTV